MALRPPLARSALAIALLALSPAVGRAAITLEQPACLPLGASAVVTVRVEAEPSAAFLRVHFRRLAPAPGASYWVAARPVGAGEYEAVLPAAEDRAAVAPVDLATWRSELLGEPAGPNRRWLELMDEETLAWWIGGLDNEAVELWAEWVDAGGRRLGLSEALVVKVLRAGCEVALDPRQSAEAENLTVGETAVRQGAGPLSGWSSDGVITRRDAAGVPRPDPSGRRAEDLFARLEEEERRLEAEAAERADGPPRHSGRRGLRATRREFPTVEVLFGTDRERAVDGTTWERADGGSAYTGGRGALELGVCEVSIPPGHAAGVLEGPGLFQEWDPARHVTLQSVARWSRGDFGRQLRGRLASQGSALVFVHGYNVTFEDAARRTAQIAADLGFSGVPMMYSWPSQGTIRGYAEDEVNVRWSVPRLEEFLALVAREAGDRPIHLIAHSMGNRAVMEVLRRFAVERAEADRPRFQTVSLVAPDVDAAVYRDEIAPRLAAVLRRGGRATLYASDSDRSLQLSSELHGAPRAGDLSAIALVTAGVATVDASRVDTSLLRLIRVGHSYFADKPSVIADLRQLLAGLDLTLRHRVSEGYWRILPP